MKTYTLERHPLSKIWGDMPHDELMDLAADIKQNGVREPIVMHEGMILDGYHRAKACHHLKIHFPTREFDPFGDFDAVEFVISANALRRHLAPGDRAQAIVEALKFKDPGYRPPSEEVAEKANVSTGTAKRAIRAAHGPAKADAAQPAAPKTPTQQKPAPQPAAKNTAVEDLYADHTRAELIAQIHHYHDNLVEVDNERKKLLEQLKTANAGIQTLKEENQLQADEIEDLKKRLEAQKAPKAALRKKTAKKKATPKKTAAKKPA